MKKPIAVLSALAASVLLTASACDQQDPCRDVQVSDEAAAVNFVRDNPHLEVEAEGYHEAECVLTPGGLWVDEADLEGEGD